MWPRYYDDIGTYPISTPTPKIFSEDLAFDGLNPSSNFYGMHQVESPITAYKKIECKNPLTNRFEAAIAELIVPEGSKIIKPNAIYENKKLRTDKAIVKKITLQSSNESFQPNAIDCECRSMYDNNYRYFIGKVVTPEKPFNPDVTTECTSGIHLFIKKRDAEQYL